MTQFLLALSALTLFITEFTSRFMPTQYRYIYFQLYLCAWLLILLELMNFHLMPAEFHRLVDFITYVFFYSGGVWCFSCLLSILWAIILVYCNIVLLS